MQWPAINTIGNLTVCTRVAASIRLVTFRLPDGSAVSTAVTSRMQGHPNRSATRNPV